jgi:hypothetical protein
MKSTTRNVSLHQARHCVFRAPSGRFCRMPIADRDSGLCYRHAFDQKKQASADLLQRLTTDSDDFTTALGIHNSLSELYKLLAADLITARRAAVLAYIANLLLRTIPIVHSELNPDADNEPAKFTVDFGDLPRPNRQLATNTTESPQRDAGMNGASNAEDENRGVQ